MKQILLFIVGTIVLSYHLFSQNLVVNPSFEKYSKLPNNTNQLNTNVLGWGIEKKSRTNTPDYFHREAEFNIKSANYVSIPKNLLGKQEPKTGDAYAGIFPEEIIGGELTKTLSKNSLYLVGFNIVKAENTKGSCDNLACYLTGDIVKPLPNNESKKNGFNFKPQIISPYGKPITEEDEWITVSGVFKATGNEKYIYIGVFSPWTEISIQEKGQKRIKNVPKRADVLYGYYYIDDVFVYELDSFGNPILEAPLTDVENTLQTDTVTQQTKYETLESGESFVLPNIVFEYGKSNLLPESYPELDSLAAYLIKHANIKIELSGHTDNSGTEEENLKLSKERAKAVYEYLHAKGINENRMSYKGYGSSQPLASNDTEEGRKQNRRVECKLLNE